MILFVISLEGILYKHGAHIVVGAQVGALIFVRLFLLLRSGSVFCTMIEAHILVLSYTQ